MESINEENASELLSAQVQVWNHTFNFINSMCLKCAVQLGIPDVIHNHGKPMTISELATALSIHSNKTHNLYRLMRILVHSSFFTLEKIGKDNCKDEGYSLTLAAHFLLKNNPFSARPFVLLILDPILTKPFDYLSTWFQNDDPAPFITANEKNFYDLLSDEPSLDSVMIGLLANDTLFTSKIVISKCKGVFEGLNSLVDVGGNTGTMAKAISGAFPHLDCTVFDRQCVVSGLRGSSNLRYVGGNMFERIPPTQAILLKWVLIDWNDEDCLKILKNCKEAITSEGQVGGKVIIIEMVMPQQFDGDKTSNEAQLFFDIDAMVMVNGGQRNEKEWANLFFDAGFTNYKISPILGLRSLIEVYP